jgi:hypothetical protein
MYFAVPDAVLMPPAAMVPMIVLAVRAAGQRHVSAVIRDVTPILRPPTFLRDRFSLLAYLIGVTAFVPAGQGVAGRRN